MTQNDLTKIISNASGSADDADIAELLSKINILENSTNYGDLFKQFKTVKDRGDFLGRVLEINFAAQFMQKNVNLQYEVKQLSRTGNIDFCWQHNGHSIFIEMKRLGQDDKTRESIAQQLHNTGHSFISQSDDTPDIGRIQRDIFGKSSATKFNPTPCANHINLVAIDVCELQLGMIDFWECVLAVGGNDFTKKTAALNNRNDIAQLIIRPNVIGAFEDVNKTLSAEQTTWCEKYHQPIGKHHPRDYIHGIVFLFRKSDNTKVLSYSLNGLVIWNGYAKPILDHEKRTAIENAFYQIVPRHSSDQH